MIVIPGGCWPNRPGLRCSPPRGSAGIARWIWKLSTCLLFMQFFVPVCRRWSRVKPRADPAGGITDQTTAVFYLVLVWLSG